MKFLTKEWSQQLTKKGFLLSSPQVNPQAAAFSESFYQTLYQEAQQKRLDLMRKVAALSKKPFQAEREAEQVILDSGLPLSATVLKVGHHGSDTSTSYPFLREIMPQYAVISVGTGNSYGHPTEETLSRLRDAGVEVFRTDMQGDIVCSSDGKTVTVQPQRNQNADTLGPAAPTEPPETQPETQAPSLEGIQVLAWPETVRQNETATVTIQGLPNTTNSITVNYKSGPSSAQGLEDKTSDGSGQVSWSWKVGGRTSPGTFNITVSGGGETLTLPFTVTE